MDETFVDFIPIGVKPMVAEVMGIDSFPKVDNNFLFERDSYILYWCNFVRIRDLVGGVDGTTYVQTDDALASLFGQYGPVNPHEFLALIARGMRILPDLPEYAPVRPNRPILTPSRVVSSPTYTVTERVVPTPTVVTSPVIETGLRQRYATPLGTRVVQEEVISSPRYTTPVVREELISVPIRSPRYTTPVVQEEIISSPVVVSPRAYGSPVVRTPVVQEEIVTVTETIPRAKQYFTDN